jgi:hypothetical protein
MVLSIFSTFFTSEIHLEAFSKLLIGTQKKEEINSEPFSILIESFAVHTNHSYTFLDQL